MKYVYINWVSWLPVTSWVFTLYICSYLSSSLIMGIWLFVKWMMISSRFSICWIILFVFTDYKGHLCPFLQNPICCHWQSLRWMERFSSADLAFATNQLITPSFSKLSAPAECNSVQDACQSARAVSLARSAMLIGLNSPWNISMSCICGAYMWDMFLYVQFTEWHSPLSVTHSTGLHLSDLNMPNAPEIFFFYTGRQTIRRILKISSFYYPPKCWWNEVLQLFENLSLRF